MIYIDEKNIEEKDIDFFNLNLLKIENYFFLPLDLKKVRDYFVEKEFFSIQINNKKNLSDNYESGFSLLNIKELENRKMFFNLDLLKTPEQKNKLSEVQQPYVKIC